MLLYSNVNSIATPQIAPTSIDQNWRASNPWHVTWGSGSNRSHEVYSTETEARAVMGRVSSEDDAMIAEWNATRPNHIGQHPFAPRNPRVFANSVIQNEYDLRERSLAVQTVAEAKRLFANEKARSCYGYKSFRDCIARGLDRIQRLYPELLAE